MQNCVPQGYPIPHVGQAHATKMAAACSGLCKLSLQGLAIDDAILLTALSPSCTQLTHLLPDRVVLLGDATEGSLGQLSKGLPAELVLSK